MRRGVLLNGTDLVSSVWFSRLSWIRLLAGFCSMAQRGKCTPVRPTPPPQRRRDRYPLSQAPDDKVQIGHEGTVHVDPELIAAAQAVAAAHLK